MEYVAVGFSCMLANFISSVLVLLFLYAETGTGICFSF